MKQFFWRLAICILPCILAAVVTTDATMKYYAGEPGGFKLGVDLVGGTILVYEIDLRKNAGDTESKFDPVRASGLDCSENDLPVRRVGDEVPHELGHRRRDARGVGG